MRLAIETSGRLTHEVPALKREAIAKLGRKHVKHRQRFLIRLLSISYGRFRPHAVHHDADTFSRAFLIKGLRVSRRRNALGPFLDPLYSFSGENLGYSRRDQLTKPYWLKTDVRQSLEGIYSSDDPVPVESSCSTRAPHATDNGLPPPAKAAELYVPSRICLTPDSVDAAIDQVMTWAKETGSEWSPLDPDRPEGVSLETGLRVLRTCRLWAISYGGLPNTYRLQSNGRFGPDWGEAHIITLPNAVRRLLLRSTDWEDFDLVSCHWSLLQCLARSLQLRTPAIDDYVGAKATWHARWARVAQIQDHGRLKSMAASWLSGGTLSSHPSTSGAKAIGSRALQELSHERTVRDLYRETRETLQQVIEETIAPTTDGSRRIIVNAVDRPLELYQGRLHHGKVYSHVLTGLEQFAIRTMGSRVGHLKAIVYDGFVAPPQDTGRLEVAVREESSRRLGFTLDLKLRREPFSRPFPDRVRDPADF